MNAEHAVEILLVEDDPHDTELALRALKQASISQSINVARDGAEALEFFFCESRCAARRTDRPPKVVLPDLKLPKLAGLEVWRRIKGDPRTQGIPVVVLTSSKEQRAVVESYRLGAHSHIVKPAGFEEFFQTVRELGIYWLMFNQSHREGI